MAFLWALILILGSALLLGQLAVRLQLPMVVGQLVAGLLLGPGILNWVHLTPSLQHLASLGVLVLMFLAGLNSDLQLLQKYLKPSLVVAILGILVPLLAIGGCVLLIGWHPQSALFLGVIFSATSVSITVAVLRELGQLNSREGTTILGAAVADDVLTVMLLGVVVSMTGERLVGQITAGMNSGVVIGIQLLFLVGSGVIAKIGIPWLFRFVAQRMTKRMLAISALLLALAFATGAELVGLSAVTGAFLAGLFMSGLPWCQPIDQEVDALGGLLLVPIFFVSIGLEINGSGILTHWRLFLLLTGLAVVTKLCGAGLGSRLMGFTKASSFVIGAGMVSRGEVAIIIAQLVYSNHLLSLDQYSTIIGAVVAATLISPLLLKWVFYRNQFGH